MPDRSCQVIKVGTFARTMAWLIPVVAAYKFASVKLEEKQRGRWNPLTPNVVLNDPRLAEDLEEIRKSVF